MQHKTTDQILQAYVASGGQPYLALEAINSDSPEQLDVAGLTLIVSQNLSKIQDLIKANILMQTFQITGLAMVSLQGKMATMLPADMGRTVTSLLDKLVALTDKHESTQNINVGTYVWENMLDQEAKAAIEYLQGQRSNIVQFPEAQKQLPSGVIDHDPHSNYAISGTDDD